MVTGIKVRWEESCSYSPPPVTMKVFDSVWLRKGVSNAETEVDFSFLGDKTERVILNYTLEPVMDCDEWDRLAGFYVFGPDGERYELARILTPFMMWGESYTFHADITPMSPLLRGRRRLQIFAGSAVNKGFSASASLTFYERPTGIPLCPVPFQRLVSRSRFGPFR
ncbi:MAG: hypothetical protein U5N86_10835 [Planctomycetota bacterium]|nr:hypothetical protein [Planctomycetota bacterium]